MVSKAPFPRWCPLYHLLPARLHQHGLPPGVFYPVHGEEVPHQVQGGDGASSLRVMSVLVAMKSDIIKKQIMTISNWKKCCKVCCKCKCKM